MLLLWTFIFVFVVDVYDVKKVVIGSVTPQRPGLFAQMYPSTFFQDSRRHTQQEKNKQIRICHHHLEYTPCRTFVYTHKHTHNTVRLRETLSSSKAQQTVKDKTEWKGGENKKMEKQSISVKQKRWTDRWCAVKRTKTAREVKLTPRPLGLTRVRWVPVNAVMQVVRHAAYKQKRSPTAVFLGNYDQIWNVSTTNFTQRFCLEACLEECYCTCE